LKVMNKPRTINMKCFSSTYILLIFLFLQSGLVIFAQEEDDLPSESIEVVKLYAPILEKGQKVEIGPVLEKVEKADPVFNDYKVPNRFLTLTFDPPGLRPLAIRGKRSAPLDHFWLRLGAGSIPMLDGALSYSNTLGDRNHWGFDLSHISANGKSVKDMMENRVDVFGRFFKGNTYIESELTFDNSVAHRFAVPIQLEIPDSLINKKDYRLRNNSIGAHVGFGSSKTDFSNFDYDSDLDYHHWWNRFGASEDLISFKSKPFKNWDNGIGVGLPLYVDYYTYKDTLNFSDSLKTSNFGLDFVPMVRYRTGATEIQVGASIGRVNDIWEESPWYVSPYLYAEVELIEKALNVYATWDRHLVRNTMKDLNQENPWMESVLGSNEANGEGYWGVLNGTEERRIAGVRGDIGGHFSFDLSGGEYLEKVKPIFTNFTWPYDTTSYRLEYSNLKSLGGHLSLAYHQNEKLGINLAGSYFSRDLFATDMTWNIPNWEIQLGAEYRFTSKLRTEASFFFRDKLEGVQADGTIIDLDGLIDLNLAAEYYISDRFGLYLKLNNLLSRKYSRYLHYDTYGFFALGGLQLKF